MKRIGIAATALAILLILIAVVAFELVGARFQPPLYKHGYRLYTTFHNVHNLKVGDRVKAFGVEIGYVEAITPDEAPGRVRVTMKLSPNVMVKIDWVAIINSRAPSRPAFVELQVDPALAPRAMPGSVLLGKETPGK